MTVTVYLSEDVPVWTLGHLWKGEVAPLGDTAPRGLGIVQWKMDTTVLSITVLVRSLM